MIRSARPTLAEVPLADLSFVTSPVVVAIAVDDTIPATTATAHGNSVVTPLETSR